MKPDLALLVLLESCASHGLEAPSGTGHIRVGEGVVTRIATEFGDGSMDPALESVRSAIGGLPVKQAYHAVIKPGRRIRDVLERDIMLRRYAAKRRERESRGA